MVTLWQKVLHAEYIAVTKVFSTSVVPVVTKKSGGVLPGGGGVFFYGAKHHKGRVEEFLPGSGGVFFSMRNTIKREWRSFPWNKHTIVFV